MAFNANAPADDQFLSDFPPEMREQLRAIVEDAIVNALKLAGRNAGNANGRAFRSIFKSYESYWLASRFSEANKNMFSDF